MARLTCGLTLAVAMLAGALVGCVEESGDRPLAVPATDESAPTGEAAPTDGDPPAGQGSDNSPAPKSDSTLAEGRERRVCLALTPAPGEVTLDGAFTAALDLGMDEPGDINMDWGRLEPGDSGHVDPDGELAMFNELYRDVASVMVTLAPIQTTYRSMPSDLDGRPWDDPELIDRYLVALDVMLAALDQVGIEVVSVGNEIDAFLTSDEELAQFARLVAAANEHLEDRGIQVGSKLTLEGAKRSAAQPLLAASDLAIVAYYPVGDDDDPWRVRPVDTVGAEIDQLIDHVAPLAVYLAEVGYPSSTEIGGSPEAQAQFVDAMFDAWDRHPDTIQGLCLVWLYDLGDEVLDWLTGQYGLDDAGFRAYLGSLGLRNADGTDKPAITILQARAAALDGG